MMDFKENRPIYLQIAGYVADRIKSGEWVEDERIPSVRELGSTLGVNPNTCMRAYEYLTREEIIYNSRGVGYFVSVGAKNKLTEMAKREFFNEHLPEILKNMNITVEELIVLLTEKK